MKFVVSSTDLSAHLQAISRVINSKNAISIFDCFLFCVKEGRLFVTASDSETTMTTSMEVAQTDTDGQFAIMARTLLEALRVGADQPLTFDVNMENMSITVSYQNGSYSLMGQSAEVYPSPAQLSENAVTVTMESDLLLEGIGRTLFATASDELRPVMNGVFFDISTEDITLVASDGHKLVRYRNNHAKGDQKSSFILPKKPAGLLKNLAPKEATGVTLQFDNRNAVIEMGEYKMVCRLIEGRYPNYNSVIPQSNPYKVTIDRLSLLGALRRVSIFSSQASNLVKLNLKGGELLISAQDIDFSTSAKESMPCQYEGEEMSIGFKSVFLIDILNNFSADEVTIELADPSRAGVIVPVMQPEGEDLLMLLMPMMLND